VAERLDLERGMGIGAFRSGYYLKEELVRFCRQEGLPVSGGKEELTRRVSRYLETGEALPPERGARPPPGKGDVTEDSVIEDPPSFSERHRAFFVGRLGEGFTFNVPFQRWLRANAGKSYGEAAAAYPLVMEERRKGKTEIGRQFEYNTYIRDFFADNEGRGLSDAIRCWRRKKGMQGSHRYDRADLAALEGGDASAGEPFIKEEP